MKLALGPQWAVRRTTHSGLLPTALHSAANKNVVRVQTEKSCEFNIRLHLLIFKWVKSLQSPYTPNTIYSRGGQTVDRGQLFGRSRPLIFKIAYLMRNWRCKLGMYELSSAERNARYWRFFELLNNPPGLYRVILNLLSLSYCKICSVMNQLHNRKVSEKHLLITVNCFSFKISIF
jgi:hypothetical protein